MKALHVLVPALLVAACADAATVPDWLLEAWGRPLPPGSDRAAAAALHHEQVVTVGANGRITTTERRAVRVLRGDGAGWASVSVPYVRRSSSVRSFRAWTLAPGGGVLRQWERRDAMDVSGAIGGDLYSDYRYVALADGEIRSGQTFGYEWVTEAAPLLADWEWQFGGEIPSAWSAFEIELPPGMNAVARTAQAESAVVTRTERSWRWRMTGIPALADESLAPVRADLGAYLFVQALPEDGARSKAGIAFTEWHGLSAWLAELAAGQAAPSPEIVAQAGAVTRGLADTLDRVRALARFVQGLNYVSRVEWIARGWGYRPHAAPEVLAAGYGDCKDKANLLCALLRAEGVESWLLTVYAGGRDRVDSAWVTPSQFNHCIAAIRAPAAYSGPLLEDGRWGRILAFDPTDPLTPFGDLPADEQGSLGLLVLPDGHGLVRLPVTRPAENRLTRRIDSALGADGRLDARLVERSAGQHAREERIQRRAGAASDYRRMLEKWLPAQGGTVQLKSVTTAEDSLTGEFRLEADYSSPTFARSVGARMLTYRPALVASRHRWVPPEEARTLPIALAAECVEETLAVRLPDGYELDEFPAGVSVVNDLGHLVVSFELRDGALVMTRRWQLNPVTVGPERWGDVRALYTADRSVRQATAVLVRR